MEPPMPVIAKQLHRLTRLSAMCETIGRVSPNRRSFDSQCSG